jgi:hypothetical protein
MNADRGPLYFVAFIGIACAALVIAFGLGIGNQ